MIENGLYNLMSNTEVPTAADIDSMDFVLNLEVLNGCAHHCTGCFVNRRNSFGEVDLNKALQVATDLAEKGLRFREVILSPTDIFSATNVEEVLTDPAFHKLMEIHPKTRITTTAMFENTSLDKIKDVFELLDNTDYFKEDMIVEFLVPLNVQRLLDRDPVYLEECTRAVEFFKTETPKIVDWSFVVNVHADPLFEQNFDEVTRIVKEDFDTVIEFLPSFFRTGNDLLIKDHLQQWRDFLTATVNPKNYRDVMLTIANMHHNGFNTIVMNYRKQKLFISPFIYEQILAEYPELEVDDISADAVIAKNMSLVADQFGYASKTTECEGCPLLNTCVGRNVLSFMEIKGLTDCIYPKHVLELYHDPLAKSLTPRNERCS